MATLIAFIVASIIILSAAAAATAAIVQSTQTATYVNNAMKNATMVLNTQHFIDLKMYSRLQLLETATT